MTGRPSPSDPDALGTREGLPDALRVLARELPREGWETHPGFSQLIRFWLERHALFRRLTALLREDAEAALDRRVDARAFARGLDRHGGLLVGELHAHHRIEDAHYFPALRAADPRIERGFDILDRDHHALDAALTGFAGAAGIVLRSAREAGEATDPAGSLLRELDRLEPLLDRHLVDEEELVVPVLLRHAPGGLV